MSESRWVDPRDWDGDARNPDTKYPFELACHNALMDVYRTSGMWSGLESTCTEVSSATCYPF